MRIDKFSGKYRFLSNFYHSQILYNGFTYRSVEAAFQAAKSLDPADWEKFCDFDPQRAKSEGRKLPLRKDWEEVKDNVMLYLLRRKFSDSILAQLLVDTGDAELIEGNTWNDTYWGVCNGIGQNKLGKFLIQVREVINKNRKNYEKLKQILK